MTGPALPGVVIDPAEHRQASLLVQFKPGASSAGSLAAYGYGTRLASSWELVPDLYEVGLHADADVEAAKEAYAADPNVVFAEPNYRLSLNRIPNDPRFSEQWNLRNLERVGGVIRADVHAPEAWDLTSGDPSVVVAVIDSGVDYTHPDLAPNMWVNSREVAGNGVDDDNNGYVDDIYGYDFVNRDGDPMDDYFHGTHVAGTIAAVADNELGIAGVAPRARIMALKFLDFEGNGFTSDAIAALNYAVANGARISNNSWGGGEFSQAFVTALQRAATAGHLFVAAAGNNFSNNDALPYYPASYNVNNVIAVAATDRGDHLAWFSNYGRGTVDIAAPGVDILSTVPVQPTPGSAGEGFSGGYGTLSGTSMAAPHVAGAAALLLAVNPGWSTSQLYSKLLSTTDRHASLASTTLSGGRLNVARALGIVPADVVPPQIIKATPAGLITTPFERIRITFSEPMDPDSFDVGDILGFLTPEGWHVAVSEIVPVTSANREFDIVFDPQSTLGSYTLTLSPHIRDVAGNELDQDDDGVGGVDGADSFTTVVTLVGSSVFSAADVPLSFSDLEPHASYLTIDHDLPIGDLDVAIDLTFPYAGRLAIWLVSPAGTIVMLSRLHGGDQADYANTQFDDSAELAIGEAEAPFTGVFRPEELLSAFRGENARGIWTLYVHNVTADPASGTLNSWSLDIELGEFEGGGGGGEGHINHPPVAVNDSITVIQSTPYTFPAASLLINDSDPDSDALTVIAVQNAVGGTVELDAAGNITFIPRLGGLAPGSFQYVVSDGLATASASVAVTVKPKYPWHNAPFPTDVDNDGLVVPRDALLVINQINLRGTGAINGVQSVSSTTILFDVVADNALYPNDALVVVNWINRHPRQLAPASATSGAALPHDRGPEPAGDDWPVLLAGAAGAGQKPAAAKSGGGNGALFLSQAEMLAHRALPVTQQPSLVADAALKIDPAAVDHALAADDEEDWLAALAPTLRRRSSD